LPARRLSSAMFSLMIRRVLYSYGLQLAIACSSAQSMNMA